MNTKERFTKGEVAEIRELYLGTYRSIRELAQIFGVSWMVMRYFLDYKGCREFHKKQGTKWQKANPEKAKIIRNRAQKKWQAKNPDKVKESQRRCYQKRKERTITK